MAGTEDEKGQTYQFILKENSELRFEVEAKSKVTMKITSGFAEMFGTELCRDRKYVFQGETGVGRYWQPNVHIMHDLIHCVEIAY